MGIFMVEGEHIWDFGMGDVGAAEWGDCMV